MKKIDWDNVRIMVIFGIGMAVGFYGIYINW